MHMENNIDTQGCTGPLAGWEVVEIGGGYAGAYCGKQFADFGATVTRVEPPGGAPERHAPPLIDVGHGQMASPLQAWLDTHKRSALIDPCNALDCQRWRDLVTRAHVVLDARALNDHGLASLAVAPSDAIHLRFSWYGLDGPRARQHGSDFVSRAVAGHVKMTGAAAGPPLVADGPFGQLLAGTVGFTGALAALLGTAPPRHIDLAVSEATIVLAEYLVAQCVGEGMQERRAGINRFPPNFPLGIYACSTGFVGVSVVTPAQWQSLCRILERSDLADDPGLRLNMDRMRQADRLDAVFRQAFHQRSAEDWFALGRAHRLPIAIVPDIAALLQQTVHRERGSFGQVRIGQAVFTAPVVPLALTATPPHAEGRAPLPGAGPALQPGSAQRQPAQRSGALPLQGVRILDLTMGWAGPVASRQMADLGADVVKIESCRYPDWWRGVQFTDDSIAAHAHERTARYNLQNRNKRVLNLDLTRPEGVAVFHRLLRGADAVMDNYSAGVMQRMGLDYAQLCAVEPGIIAMSMPAFGTRSSWSDLRAYGSTFEHASGLPTVLAGEDGLPRMSHQALGDPVGGVQAAAALLVALHARRATGQGQFIDLSQVQCLLPLLAPWIVQHTAGLATPEHPRVAGQASHLARCYRCAGDDDWIAVTVDSQAQWHTVCAMLHVAPAPADGPPPGVEEVDRALAAWVVGLPLAQAVTQLQAIGVAAGPVLYPSELQRDPQLQARGFWQTCDRAYIGPHLQASLPLQLDGRYLTVRRPAPLFGQHNAEILAEAGLTAQEVQALIASGVVGDVPLSSPVPLS
jgi:crotonobetainyl-CoA:carnitine CoA-transferase CaiB-like acyl-CoA transferase